MLQEVRVTSTCVLDILCDGCTGEGGKYLVCDVKQRKEELDF